MINIILIGFLLIVGISFSQSTGTTTYTRGKVYETVVIGSQTWMAEDLQVIKYNNGDPIFQAKSEEDWSNFGKTQKGCFYELNNGIILYNGYALKDPREALNDRETHPDNANAILFMAGISLPYRFSLQNSG